MNISARVTSYGFHQQLWFNNEENKLPWSHATSQHHQSTSFVFTVLIKRPPVAEITFCAFEHKTWLLLFKAVYSFCTRFCLNCCSIVEKFSWNVINAQVIIFSIYTLSRWYYIVLLNAYMKHTFSFVVCWQDISNATLQISASFGKLGPRAKKQAI